MNLTQTEARNIADFIEINIFGYIRDDEAIDNIAWLADMIHVYEKCREMERRPTDTNVGNMEQISETH